MSGVMKKSKRIKENRHGMKTKGGKYAVSFIHFLFLSFGHEIHNSGVLPVLNLNLVAVPCLMGSIILENSLLFWKLVCCCPAACELPFIDHWLLSKDGV